MTTITSQITSCLLNRLFRRRSKKTSKLRVTGLCLGNSPGPVNSPHKGPVTRKKFPFDDVLMCARSRAPSRYEDRLSGYGVSIIKIRRSPDRLICIMGILILVRRPYIYIYIYIYTHTYTHTYIYIHIYIITCPYPSHPFLTHKSPILGSWLIFYCQSLKPTRVEIQIIISFWSLTGDSAAEAPVTFQNM